MMRIVPSVAALALPILLAAPGASAQVRHDSSAPIDFDAQSLELQDKANRAILSGNVVIRQASMTLNAARVIVGYTGEIVGGSPSVSRIDASGGVTITRPDQSARAQYAVYDLNARVITMLGGVTLTQGANTISGGRLSINLDTGLATVDGSAASGAGGTTTNSGGRVSGRFSVPKRD